MKRVLAYIFLIIFSFQILPVKEIGKILFKGQITEEEVRGDSHGDGDSQVKLKKEGDPLFHPDDNAQASARIAFLTHQISTLIHEAEHLPKTFVPDILTPPPNFS